ncbi:hypothetical protein [Caulobacter sp. 17J65-9]|uniref:hypothetical protein n=1 Tax=Caulobacter sp. 17J65-9 TaxID=2709382 RepID=UPI0013C58548|nr:hypothetical protein [Caulobacter sp. 17J65-9]NEX94001.1 hypothetical protein [Caulobacter sp. 17J65-9]
MTEWIPAGLEPGGVGERVYASTSEAEAREAIGAAADDDARLAGAVQAGANLADLSDPVAALAQLKGARMVGLFVELEGETMGEDVVAVFTAGHTRSGLGAARYVLDADQASPSASAWRRRSADGFWFALDEAEPTFEQFGALGQADHLNPSVDDTAAIVGGAVAWSNLTGRPVRAGGRIYNVRDTIELTYGRLKGVGSTNSGAGALATSCLLFSHLGAKPGIRTTLATSKKLALIEGFDLRAASWDPVTGCTGYGLDIGARLIARDLSVQHWGKSGLFLHGGVAGGGPYHSRFETFLFSKEHGAVVGTGANAVTFVDCEWKWNGAPSYGVAPTAAGTWDGLHVNHTGAGNPSGAYASYTPDALSIIGGDASYNSRYGYNFASVRRSGALFPGYAELNLATDGQVYLGGDFGPYCFVHFGTISGGSANVKMAVYGSYGRTNQIYVGGEYLGGGGTGGSKIGYTFQNVGLAFAVNTAGDVSVASVPSSAATGQMDVRVDGAGARIRLGSNLTDYFEVASDGVKLPASHYKGGKKRTQDTAAPATGTWAVGDIVENSSPASYAPFGWVCVTAGTPGSWREIGPRLAGGSGGSVFIPQGGAYLSRDFGNTADLQLLTVGSSANNNLFVGHGTGAGVINLQSGSGGVNFAPSGTTVASLNAARFAVNTDNALDFGTSAARIKDGYSYTWDAKTSFKVNGTKVVGAQEAGWTAASGTPNKGAWNADAVGALAFSATPTQAECVALRDACASAHKRMKATEDALRTHGLIN